MISRQKRFYKVTLANFVTKCQNKLPVEKIINSGYNLNMFGEKQGGKFDLPYAEV